MTWFKVDDQSTFNPKVLAAGNEAWGAFCRMGAYCSDRLTDGHINNATALTITSKKVLQKLITAGLLESTEDGYILHDYLQYNPTREHELTKRAAAKDRMDRLRGVNRSQELPPISQDSSSVVRANKTRTSGDVRSLPYPVSPYVLSEHREETPSAPKKGERERGSRIPADWNPTPEAILQAEAKHPNVNLSRETEKFRNHWMGKAERRVDWLACWRNWIINSEQYASERGDSSSAAKSPDPEKLTRQDIIAQENGMNIRGFTNQDDPEVRKAKLIKFVEDRAAEWGLSYEAAAERIAEERKRDFPKMIVMPIPPKPVPSQPRQGMAA